MWRIKECYSNPSRPAQSTVALLTEALNNYQREFELILWIFVSCKLIIILEAVLQEHRFKKKLTEVPEYLELFFVDTLKNKLKNIFFSVYPKYKVG